ncbi:MAG: TonB-dependent receptor [Bacteroidetes bacterium]|nr:MAG: TonB-dependent receptor [Bacteroidota bacterium]
MTLYTCITYIFLLLFTSTHVYSVSFSGRVTDPDGKPLAGATVRIELSDLARATSTNYEGYYHFTGLIPGKYMITVSFVGYQNLTLAKEIADDTTSDFNLLRETVFLDEVMIEDRYEEQRRRERTITVEVVGTEFMRIHANGSLMHTLNRLPGIQAINVGSGQSKPLIRGLGFNRIVVTEHGIKHEGQQWGHDHSLEVDQFAHNHIELVKGPASLVYGSDAIGGVVQLSQREIPEAGSLKMNVDVLGRSSNQLLGTSAALEGRNDEWFFTSRITLLDYGDTRVPVDSVDVYSYRVPLYKNRLRNTAGNELSLHSSFGYVDNGFHSRFFVSHVRQRAGFFANAHGLEPRRVDTDLYDRSDREILYPRQDARHFKLVNRSVFESGNSIWTSLLGYQHNYREEFSQYVNHGYKPPVFPDTLAMPSDLERKFDKHTFSGSIQMTHRLSDQQELTAGLSTEFQDNNIGGVSFLIPAFRQWQWGGYLLHEWVLRPGLRVNYGMRYDFFDLRTESYHDWFPTEEVFLQRAEAIHRTFSSLSGMAGVNLQKEQLIFRMNFGRSYRVPLAKELAANGVNYHHFSYEVGDPSLEPETAWQLDLGIDYDTPVWSARFSPFVTYFPNYIYLNPSYLFDFNYGAGNQVFNYTASEIIRWGGEITVLGNLTENLMVELTAEHVYSEQLSGDKKGFTVPFSPPASLLAGANWKPWGNKGNRDLRQLAFRVDARFTAAQNRIVPPERKTPAYQVFNLGVNGIMCWNQTPLNWNITVNNLLNTQYLEHTSYYRLIGVPEPGRNITLSVHVPVDIFKND